jgi:hypothetical protein
MPKGIVWSDAQPEDREAMPPCFRLTDPLPRVQAAPPAPAARIHLIMPDDPTIPALWASWRKSKLTAERLRASTLAEARQGPDGKHLVRRLRAIELALKDLPRQAKRLLRWQARRQRMALRQFTYTQPLRPGQPPWHASAPKHSVTQVLQECHELSYETRFDTS